MFGDGEGDEVGFGEVSGAAVANDVVTGVAVPDAGVPTVCDEVGVGVDWPSSTGVGSGSVGAGVRDGAASGARVGPSVGSVAGAVGLGVRLGSDEGLGL